MQGLDDADDGLRSAVPGDLLSRLLGVIIWPCSFCCASISSDNILTFCSCTQYILLLTRHKIILFYFRKFIKTLLFNCHELQVNCWWWLALCCIPTVCHTHVNINVTKNNNNCYYFNYNYSAHCYEEKICLQF